MVGGPLVRRRTLRGRVALEALRAETLVACARDKGLEQRHLRRLELDDGARRRLGEGGRGRLGHRARDARGPHALPPQHELGVAEVDVHHRARLAQLGVVEHDLHDGTLLEEARRGHRRRRRHVDVGVGGVHVGWMQPLGAEHIVVHALASE